jgi:hypothetical protein
MKWTLVALMLVSVVGLSQPSSNLFYGPKDLNFNILDYDSMRVWQTERGGHGLWWQHDATKDCYFLRTDTVGIAFWYLDVSGGSWAKLWDVNAAGVVTSASTLTSVGLVPTTTATYDIGTAIVLWDSVFAGHVKTTNVNVSGASTLDSAYARTILSPIISGTTITGTTIKPTHMTLALHAIVAGDSVFGNTLLNSVDTVLIMWNGTAWKTIADMGP